MSLRSMTGYGRGAAAAGGMQVNVELSSVNRKQMDISVTLPRSLGVLEPRVEEVICEAMSRGRITGEVYVRLSPVARRRSVCVDQELAKTYVENIRKVAKKIGLKDDLSGSDLLSLPDVIRYEQPTDDAERVWPVLHAALKQALAELLKMRLREGAALQRDLKARLKTLVAALARVRESAPKVVEVYRGKLRARLESAGFSVDTADERLLRELALFADRSDITEEITRLDSHIQQATKLLDSKEPVGRSLDFLAQEMFREVNTMGSKANDTGIIREVVEIKAELERIREQVQNIE